MGLMFASLERMYILIIRETILIVVRKVSKLILIMLFL